MRKAVKKKRLALLLVAALAVTQIPQGYAIAEESSVVQETVGEDSDGSNVSEANENENTGIPTESTDDEKEADDSSDVKEDENTESTSEKGNDNVKEDSAETKENQNTDDVSNNVSEDQQDDNANTDEVGSDEKTIDEENTEQKDTSLLDKTKDDSEDKRANLFQGKAAGTEGLVIEDNIVIDYTGESAEVVIPDGVVAIGDSAFEFCDYLTSVEIPNSVTSIGRLAFSNCKNLKRANLPNKLTNLGDRAFSWCYNLVSMEIPNTLTSINEYTFERCIKLISVEIPSSIKNIEEGAFSYCKSLLNINIPEGLDSIKDVAFFGCQSLKSIIIPDSVKDIGYLSFAYCRSVKSIEIPNSVISIGKSSFAECFDLTSITIPNSVTSIGDNAFAYCKSLTSIEIPNTVTSIGNKVFFGCNNGKVYTTVTSGAATNFDSYFIIYCNSDSYACIYAKENDMVAKPLNTPEIPTEIKVESVSINESSIELKKDESLTLTASVLPNNAANKNISWISSNTKVAIVDESGRVTGKSAGEAIITVKTEEGNKTAACKVVVKQEESIDNEEKVTVNSIKLNIKKVEMAKKAEIKVTATVSPENAENSEVIWSTSNSNIVNIKSKTAGSAIISAKKAGSAVITATAADGSGVSASCKVKVLKNKSYKIKYKLNKGNNADTNPTYYASGTTVKLANPTRKNYTFSGWYIGDKKVTSINKKTSGNITLTAKWKKVSVGKTTVKSVINKKSKTLAVAFNKVNGAKGYTVYYSTNSKLKNASKINLSSKKRSATLTKLKKGKSYYVTVKAYKKDSLGNKIYGKSNKIFKVKIKK